MSLCHDWENARDITRFEHEVKTYFDDNRHGCFCALLVIAGYPPMQYSTVRNGFDPYNCIDALNMMGICSAHDYLVDPKVVLALDLLSANDFNAQIPWKPGTVKDPMALYDSPVIALPPRDCLSPALRHDRHGRVIRPAPGFIRGVIPGGAS